MENKKKHIEISAEIEGDRSRVKITGYSSAIALVDSSYNVMQAIAEVASEQLHVDSQTVLKAMIKAFLTNIENEED